MFDHLKLLLGPIGTVTTAKRQLLGVRQEVVPETGGPAEGLLAHAAGVRSLVTVLLLVGLQNEAGLEGFAAFLADVGPHITVPGGPVGTEGVRSVGTVVALVAAVRLFPYTQMRLLFWMYFTFVYPGKKTENTFSFVRPAWQQRT